MLSLPLFSLLCSFWVKDDVLLNWVLLPLPISPNFFFIAMKF